MNELPALVHRGEWRLTYGDVLRCEPWRRPVFLPPDLPPTPDDDTDLEDQQP